MLFAYKGLDGSGRKVSGAIDAMGLKEARTRLKSDGVYITDIREEKMKKAGTGLANIFRATVPQKEMTSLYRQLGSLLTAGIPLMQCLEAAEKQSASDHLKKVLNSLKDDVRQGEPLATAMERHPDIFDKLSCAMVRAGETGGNLAVVLSRLADYKEATLRRESAVKSATVYPVVMAIFGLGVIIFLVMYVVPKIIVIFDDLEQALPLSTEILIAITNFLVGNGYLLGALLAGGLLALSRYVRTEHGKRIVDRILIRLPIIGPLAKSAVLARWSHTASALLSSGVPLLQTLKLSREVAGNALYADAIADAGEIIREGGAIAPSLEKSGLFPPVAIQMIAAGEKSGQSAVLLAQVARDQAAEMEDRIAVLLSLIQPALITTLGLVVGFIVMAILLPILQISQMIG